MFTSPIVRKFARVALTSATAGAALALVLLGGPADAAVHAAGRGF